MSFKACFATAAVVLLLTLAGCDGSKPVAPESASPATASASTRFEVGVGDQKVSMRLAITPKEQKLGLMHTVKLEENEGMIFISETPRQGRFWMQNVPIDLDIGFFDASGTLLEVRRMWRQEERNTVSSSEAVKYSLEMSYNWFSSKGLKVGSKLDLNALREAVKSRGIDPGKLGM